MKNLINLKKAENLAWVFGAALSIFSCTTDESLSSSDFGNTSASDLSTSSVELPVSNTVAEEEQSANPASNATDSDPESRWSGFGSSGWI